MLNKLLAAGRGTCSTSSVDRQSLPTLRNLAVKRHLVRQLPSTADRFNLRIKPARRSSMMNRFAFALAACALTIGAHAASPDDKGVTVSTDPAKAEAVERHAQELAAQQSKAGSQMGQTKGSHQSTHHGKPHRRHSSATKANSASK
jgi:hypothetical protein